MTMEPRVIYSAFRIVGGTREYFDVVFHQNFVALISLGRLGHRKIPSVYEKQIISLQKQRLRSRYNDEKFIRELCRRGIAKLIPYSDVTGVELKVVEVPNPVKANEYEKVLRVILRLRSGDVVVIHTSTKLKDFVKEIVKSLSSRIGSHRD